MLQFIHGGTFVAALATALFFWRFWKETNDPFFAFFSAAFLIMGLERVMLLVPFSVESQPYIYLFRLVAFSLILLAIYEKNHYRRRVR